MSADNGHHAVSELIGAWALDACSPTEADLVRAHLAGCVTCAGEARSLRETAGSLLVTPPAGLGARLRSAMPLRRRPSSPTPAYANPYAAQVSALDLLLTGLTGADWQRIAAYERMSVQDLLTHLMAVDGMLAAALGLEVSPPVLPGVNAADRTAAVLEQTRGRPPAETLRAWREQADAVCAALPPRPDTVTMSSGRSMPVADAMLARSFETWIHREDIAGAVGGPLVTPLAGHLHPMADLAVRLLPSVTARQMPGADGRQLRLRLTGAGGGSWLVPLGRSRPAAEPVAGLTLDVVEFCRLVGGRRDPARMPVQVTGDGTLAREWLTAATALAAYP